ncbi:HNH endonuclease, partial [Vibrio cholerae O1]|nr:HNH endonuclease [Vibrio cholerae O1]
ISKWAVCSVPGCTRKAVTSEIDHIIPFFHLDPLKGGLTRFGNLHPLCKRHHAIKTADRFRVRMLDTGTVEYEFRHGV